MTFTDRNYNVLLEMYGVYREKGDTLHQLNIAVSYFIQSTCFIPSLFRKGQSTGDHVRRGKFHTVCG